MMSSNGCATLAAVAFMKPAASCPETASPPPHPPSTVRVPLAHHASVSSPSCFAAFPLHQPLSLGLDQPHCKRDWQGSLWAPWQGGFWGSCSSISPSVLAQCQALSSVTKARWAPVLPTPVATPLEQEGWLPLTSEHPPQRPVTDSQSSDPTLLWDSVSFILYTCDFVQL